MAKSKFDDIGQTLKDDFGIEISQMFGKPCFKINKKAFASYFQDAMVFKLGKDRVDEMLMKYEGSLRWDPSGKNRPMKDWIQMPKPYENQWEALAKKALTNMTQ